MKVISKSALAEEVSKETGDSVASTKKTVDAVFSIMKRILNNGDAVAINGFGSLTPSVRPSRVGRNPATGESVNILEKKVVKFKASKDLV